MRRRFGLLWLAGSLLMIVGLPVFAVASPILNGGFEDGSLAGWQTIGDAMVVDTSYGAAPIQGSFQALVTNATGFWSGPMQFAPFSGTSSVEPNALFNFVGLTFFDVSMNASLPPAPAFGSAMQQSFSANAGDVLSFHWDYLTQEPVFDDVSLYDYAFVVLDGQISLLATNHTADSASPTPFLNESGYRTFSTALTTSGNHTLAIGVVHSASDTLSDSGLLVDHITVAALPVPEPSTLLLLSTGLVGLAGVVWRRHRRD